MATLVHFCLLLTFLFLLHSTRGEQTCDTTSCGEIDDIQFPFGLKGANQSSRCSYPGFQLSCNKHNKAILTLPDSGDLVVKSINYENQTILVNDPDGCLAKRFLKNLSYSILSTPFMFDAYELYDLSFLHCPSNVTESYHWLPISCLSDPSNHKGNHNFSSVMVPSHPGWQSNVSSPLSECEVMSSILNNDLELKWNRPSCGNCAASGQLCGFTRNTSLRVGCFSSPNQSKGLPRSVKYGLTIGVGIPGLLCIIGLSCFICSKIKIYTHPHRPSPDLPTSIIALQPAPFIMGLEGPEIEKFPKTLIGDSGRLPKPNDNTCPICLSEYEPKETLRTIPECNHYFHAHCIDEWLKMNATCPLCRNSPDASSTVAPSSSLSISSSWSSSP